MKSVPGLIFHLNIILKYCPQFYHTFQLSIYSSLLSLFNSLIPIFKDICFTNIQLDFPILGL
jgi:hypothetical protein